MLMLEMKDKRERDRKQRERSEGERERVIERESCALRGRERERGQQGGEKYERKRQKIGITSNIQHSDGYAEL